MEIQDLDDEEEERLAQLELAEEGFSSDSCDEVQQSGGGLLAADIIVTPSQIKQLWLMEGFDKQLIALSHILKRPLYDSCLTDGVFVDFTFYNIHFCKETGFSAFKAANIVAMMNIVFDHAMKSKFLNINETYEILKKSLTEQILSFNASKERHKQFTSVEVTRLTDYITTSFFRYFRLYRYVFMSKRDITTDTLTIVAEIPRIPTPLNEGRQREPGRLSPKARLRKKHSKAQLRQNPVRPVPAPAATKEESPVGTSSGSAPEQSDKSRPSEQRQQGRSVEQEQQHDKN